MVSSTNNPAVQADAPDSPQAGHHLANQAQEFSQKTIVPNRKIPAWVLSCILHAIIFACLLIILSNQNRGGSEVENRTGGIVLVKADSQQTEYLSEGESETESSASQDSSSPPPATINQQLPPDLPGLDLAAAPITGTGDDLIQALPGVDGLLEMPQTKQKIGGKITTEVFGIKGTGSKFLYVFDRSKSMEGYSARPLIAAKQQMLASLDSLSDVHQFQIIFYNNTTEVFRPNPGPPEMLFASKEIKKKANRFVQRTRGEGGTDHMGAIQFALSLGPDVIFLLTDAEGGFSSSELAKIRNSNRSGAVINAIEFGVGSQSGQDRSLEALARQSGGQYSYKNIRTLRIDQ